MKILVTGGAGFVGSHLIDRLLAEGHQVVCLDNFDPFYAPQIKKRNIEHNIGNKNFALIEGDVRDKEKLKQIFEENGVRQVVHLAAKVGVRQSLREAAAYESVNVGGTLALLEACKDSDIDNFIYGSSSSVYGASQKVPFREDQPPRPISPYGASKAAAELLCYAYHHSYNFPVTCLRFFTVYGPRQRPEMAIHKFTRLIDEGREIEVYGDGTSKRDYTYIDDVVEGITKAITQKFDFEIFNIGNSEPVELRQLIAMIEKSLGKKVKIKWLPEQPGDVSITWADFSKAKQLLGFSPKVKIEEGIERFVRWYKETKFSPSFASTCGY